MKIIRNVLWTLATANCILPIILSFIKGYLMARYLYYVIGVVGAMGLAVTIGFILYRAVKQYKFEKNNIFLSILFFCCMAMQMWFVCALTYLDRVIVWE